jgi:F-type H+-transporting ATPase subunit delta
VANRDDSLAHIYAGALLDLAFEKGVHAETLAELKAFEQVLGRVPQFVAFLNTPRIRREAKAAVLAKVFGNRVSDYTLNFFRVVVDKGRQHLLPKMIVAFVDGYHERMGEVVVKVQSAVPLEDGQKQRLSRALKKKFEKDIILEERVNPRLLGGLVMSVGDTRIDGSLRSRLEAVGARLEAARVRSQDNEDQG